MVPRAIFVLLSALAGMALFIKADSASAPYWLYGFGIGAVTGGLILAGEYALRNLSFGIIAGGTAGLAAGLVLTLLASAIGLAAAVALTRFMASMLFNVAPTDPLTFALVGSVLGLVAMAATFVPARRAMRVNPVTALRE